MLRTMWFRLSGSVFPVTFLFLISSALPVSGLKAQTPPSFASAQSSVLNTGNTDPISVATGDLTGSGNSDLVVADNAGNIYVYLNQPDGSFKYGGSTCVGPTSGTGIGTGCPTGSASHGGTAITVSVANIKGSPNILVIYSYWSGSKYGIEVLQFTPSQSGGSGAFSLLQTVNLATPAPASLAIHPTCMVAGNFGGTGDQNHQDVAVAGGVSGNRQLVILKNSSSGTLASPSSNLFASDLGSSTPTAITTGIFTTGDAGDLATANLDGSVSVLLATTAGVFGSSHEYPAGTTPLSAIAPFSINNVTSLAVAESGANQVWVLPGDGSGTFNKTKVSYPVGSDPVAILAQDASGNAIDLNGNNDLIVINGSSSTFSVLLGNSASGPTFNPAIDYAIGETPIAAAAISFPCNSTTSSLNLVSVNQGSQTVSVACGNGNGTFQASPAITPENASPAGYQPISVASSILDSSGISSLVVANYCADLNCAAGNVAVYSGETYNSPTQTPVAFNPLLVTLANVTNSNYPDIIALGQSTTTANGQSTTTNQVSDLKNTTTKGLATFPTTAPTATNLDGIPIAVVGNFEMNSKPAIAVLECGTTTFCKAGDGINGQIEILTFDSTSGAFTRLGANSVGKDPTSIDLATGSGGTYIVEADCGNDSGCRSGKVNLWSLTYSNNTLTFISTQTISVSSGMPSSVKFAELKSSGGPYLLVANSTNQNVDVFSYDSTNGFTSPQPYSVGLNPGALVVADFNGDGFPDVAVANYGDSTVSILTGDGTGALYPSSAWPVATNPVAMAAIINPVGGVGQWSSNGTGGIAGLATVNGTAISKPTVPTAEITLLQTGTQAVGALTLSASQESAGGPVSVTATLAPASGGPAPTGYVSFKNNDGTFISACIDMAVGSATCPITPPTTSTITVIAVYGGDGQYAPAVSSILTLAPTNTANVEYSGTLVSGSFELNEPVTLSTTVSSHVGSPSGTVNFTISGPGTVPACTPNPPVVSGTTQYSCVAVFGETGEFSGTATFMGASVAGSGNQFFFTSSSSSNQTSVSINGYETDTSLTSPSSLVVNEPVSFSATVAVDPTSGYTGTAVPSGMLIFTDDSQSLCTAPLTNSTLNASCTAAVSTSGLHTIKAAYTPGAGSIFAPSSANPTIQVDVDPTNLTMVLASSSSSVVNQVVKFSATVTPTYGAGTGPAYPSGSVTFTYGTSGQLCTATLAPPSPTVSCSAAIPAAGSYAISAVYNGDSNFVPSQPTQASVNQTVAPDPTNLTMVLASPSSSVVNQVVQFSATITPTYGAGSGPAYPSGSVTFTYGTSGQLCTAILAPPSPTASCSAAIPTAGSSYAINAVYNGDLNFAPSQPTQASVNQTVTLDLTNLTTVLASPSSSIVNQVVAFSATVTPTYGAGTGPAYPSGSVTFTYGTSGQLCTATLAPPSPTVSCSAAIPTAGSSYAINAVYNGDSNFAPSQPAQASVKQAVTPDPTVTSALTWSPSKLTVNESVTFTATVGVDTTNGYSGSIAPSGTVTFSYGSGQPSCTASLTPSATTASCTILAAPPVGSYTITATYNGDGGNPNFIKSSVGVTASVGQATPTGVWTTTATTPGLGQAVSYAATFNFGGCATTPTESVAFYQDSNTTASCTMPLNSNSCTAGGIVNASCSIAFSSAGQHSVSAVYLGGDTNFIGITLPPLAISVQKAPSTVSVTSVPTTSIASQSVTFNATVGTTVSGAPQPTGTVYFSYASSPTQAINGCSFTVPQQTVSCQIQLPNSAAGSFSVNANYSGDNNFLGNIGTVIQTVQNFGLTFSPPTVNLTQGYSTAATNTSAGNDPFFPTSIKVTEIPVSGFQDPLTVSCGVTNSSGTSANDPSCAISVTSLGGSTGAALLLTVNASSKAPVDSYSVSLTATDNNLTSLVQTFTLPLNVVNAASPMVLVQGISGTEAVSFATSVAPSQLSFSCGAVKYFSTTNNTWALTTDPNQTPTCSFSSGTATSAGNIVSVPITISSLLVNSSQVQRNNSVYLAELLGLPLFLLIGWRGRRKETHKNFLRFFGLVLLLAGLSAMNGCGGGGFTRPAPPPSNVIDAGSYLVQVVATDNNHDKFYAIVPLTVNKN